MTRAPVPQAGALGVGAVAGRPGDAEARREPGRRCYRGCSCGGVVVLMMAGSRSWLLVQVLAARSRSAARQARAAPDARQGR